MHIKKRGIYLLPNILTTFGLFSGFYSVIFSIQGQFTTASIAIFIAMLWDGLDGRVARLTNTQSEFGEQYDSMADLVSFGIAPAFLVYFYILSLGIDFGKLNYLVPFLYVTGASLRLARFNAQIHNIDKNYFQGLPSPTAAALIAGAMWVIQHLELLSLVHTQVLASIILVLLISAGVLMVSNIRYYSFKTINFKDKSSFKHLLLLIAVIILVLLYPPLVLFGFFFVYTISGVIFTLKQIAQKRRKKTIDVKKE